MTSAAQTRRVTAEEPQPERLQPKLVTADVVARYLSIATSTVYQLANEEKIPHRRIGRSRRFVLAEIDAWLECQRRGPGV